MQTTDEIFSGKLALITGAAKRLGREIALELAARRCRVIVHYHQSEIAAQNLVAQLRERGVVAETLRADLSNRDEVDGLMLRAVELAGPVDYLINNAAIYAESSLNNLQPENLDAMLRLNAYAPLQLSRAFAQQGTGGAIVNLLDARMDDYDREHLAYHLSKRMLKSLTKILAWELAPRARVNGIAPGLILPPAAEDNLSAATPRGAAESLEWLETRRPTNPLNAYGSSADVAAAALILLGADFVTGEVIHVDGGRHLRGNFYG
jgi:NAD(P)-dependent dehydrogenase (short-subunit alcohol dehydrogenase family)